MSLSSIFTTIYSKNSKHEENETIEWGEPIPLQYELSSVLPLHPSNFPAPFHDWIMDVADRMQCPPDFIAVSAIVATAAIIGTGCGVKPKQHDDWLVIPNLWGGLVGQPGKLKSPAVAEALSPLNQLEREAKKQFDAEMTSYLADMELYKAGREALKDALLKSSKQALQRKSASQELDTQVLKEKLMQCREPAKPIWKRYKTNDATVEKLHELMAENPRGLLLFRDELIGLLSSWDKEGRETDRAYFLETWNGYGSLTTDRIGRGTVHTENPCLSIFGNIQPARLAHYLDRSIRGGDNDGLLQRFQLLIYPDHKDAWKLIDRAPDLAAKERAAGIFKNLATMNFFDYGASKVGQDKFPNFHFDDAAQDFFNDWVDRLENVKLKKDESPIILEHLSKYRSLMPSLALIFHLINLADGQKASSISVESARIACTWLVYLENHARKIYGMANSIVHQAAIKLGNKILDGQLQSPFSVRDVYRKEWTLLDNRETVQEACNELADSEWLAVQELPKGKGRPKTPIYYINPKLNREKLKQEKQPKQGDEYPTKPT
jgi:hypothetical protein